jgi:agmatine deiminase
MLVNLDPSINNVGAIMIADWDKNCVFLAAMLKARHPVLFSHLRQTLAAHRIEVRLLDKVQDFWARDYCPVQVCPSSLVKFRYDPDYLRDEPALKTGDEVIESFRRLGRCSRSPIILDGGNVVGSRTKAIVTEKIYKENPSWSRAELRDKLQYLLQVDQLIVIPKEPYEPFGHADALVRFIDEDRVLVNDHAQIDPGFGERLNQVLRRHKLCIETIPYLPEKRSMLASPRRRDALTIFCIPKRS